MDKYFEEELRYIKDKRIRENLVIMINKLPDYFFEVPASSTGKYHPTFSLGKGGLLRHTKAAVRIAVELFNDISINNFNQNEKDLIIRVEHVSVVEADLHIVAGNCNADSIACGAYS